MAPLRVVLVDDSDELRRLLAQLLELRGCEVVGQAANGEAALAVLDEVECDVVVLDLNMPVMDGRETTIALRRRHPDVDIVAFSVSDDAVIAQELKPLGIHAHFSKLDVDALVDYVAGVAIAGDDA